MEDIEVEEEQEGKEPPSIDIEALAGQKKRILLRGGAGTGKTTLIGAVWRLSPFQISFAHNRSGKTCHGRTNISSCIFLGPQGKQVSSELKGKSGLHLYMINQTSILFYHDKLK